MQNTKDKRKMKCRANKKAKFYAKPEETKAKKEGQKRTHDVCGCVHYLYINIKHVMRVCVSTRIHVFLRTCQVVCAVWMESRQIISSC